MKIFRFYLFLLEVKDIDAISNNSNIFYNRLFLVLWCFIFPLIIIFISVINSYLFKKDVFLIYKSLNRFFPYKYFLHNVCFCFFLSFFSLNTFFFFYSIFDFFLFDLDKLFTIFWEYKGSSGNFQKSEFFWKIIFIGYFLNSSATFLYIYHNLYRTDSFFSEWWEKKMKTFENSRFFVKFEKKFPRIANKIRNYFLVFKKYKLEKKISFFF